MKHMLTFGALLLAPFFVLASGDDAPTRYTIDAKTSTITWEGTNVTRAHNGDIAINNGMITVDNGMISAATVVIDMTTINTLDLEGGSKGHPVDIFGMRPALMMCALRACSGEPRGQPPRG